MSEEYEVGYGRPPKEGQFTKGRSGNPKGRPKGSKNIATMFNEITRELINVTENGRTKTVTRIEAVLHRMTNEALSGKPQLIREFIQLSRAFEEVEKSEEVLTEPNEREAVVLQNVLKRMMRTSDSAEAGARVEPDVDSAEEDDE
jgi:Family of unknown function (DUF5681)